MPPVRLSGLGFDLRIALRGLRRDRAFTLTAIATLALAIGLNVTAFTVMDAMLFRGLPLAERSDRLVFLGMRKPSSPGQLPGPLLHRDVEAWRAQTQTLEGIAFSRGGPITFRDGSGRSLDMNMQRLSANAFGLLGVAPILGRDFVPADDVPGAPPVAILDYHFWESRFGKRAEIVGQTVYVNGSPTTVIGVMPEGFVFVYEQNLWMPLAHSPELLQRDFEGGAFGRLRDGATRRDARTELETITRRLDLADPETNRGVPSVMTYAQGHLDPDAPAIYGSLWVGTWFVLLIACANLANLTLVRTTGQRREVATRIALGAGIGRMTRLILVESFVLAGIAGAVGWWIATWSVGTWAATTRSRYLAIDYTIDSGTLAYLVAISVAAAILLSLAPIGRLFQLGRSGAALTGDARGVTQGPRGKRLTAGLVAGQMALAIVLLSGAGVLVRSFVNIVSAETGVRDPENILVGLVRLPSDTYPDAEKRSAYFDRLSAELKTIPGIGDASVSSSIPTRTTYPRAFEVEGRPSAPDDRELAQFLTAGSGYFQVMGASAISGRGFDDRDHGTALPVAIVNQSFAARFWPGEQPVGNRLRTLDRNAPGEWRTVVGVVPNIMQGDATRQSFQPVVYSPFRQQPTASAFFFARAIMPPDQVAGAVRAEVQRLDPDLIVEDFTTLKAKFAFDRDYMDLEHSEIGKHAAVAPLFALIALLLAAIGLGAVVARSVTQRTKEIGVRMAIGAAARDISRMVLREGMLPVAMGTILGLAASFAVNRVLRSQLVGVSAYDPITMTAAPVVLIAVALIACQLPARRAMRVDPAVALRHE